jgi:hypothetical protein
MPLEERARRLQGRRLRLAHHDARGPVQTVRQLRAWLPAGTTANGAVRQDDLLQFVSTDGGLFTVRAKDVRLA